MRRLVVFMLILLGTTAPIPSSRADAAEQTKPTYKIVIDNEELRLADPPFLEAGTTMVPFRPVFDRLGMTVAWDTAKKQITAHGADREIVLTLGSNTAYVNGSEANMPLAPVIQEGVAYVPLRFVGDASGGDVELYGGGLNVVWVLSAKQVALLDAIYGNDLESAERLLKNGADPTVLQGPLGPESYAFIHESIEMVELFLRYGMDIDYCTPDWYGLTLLQNAVSWGKVDTVRYLLEAGADPNVAGGRLGSPLEIAVYWRDQIAGGYRNVVDERLTPTVEEYDTIIRLLEDAGAERSDDMTQFSYSRTHSAE